MPLPSRFPRATTPFVGRERERGRIEALLEGGASLVTVTGAPGVGKTRFVEEMLARAADEQAIHGVLDDVITEQALVRTVARALGQRVRGPLQTSRFAVHLGGRLVVLDHADGLDEGARAAVADWAARGTRIVVTSREPLRVRGEQLLPLAPLDVSTPTDGRSERPAAVELLIALLRGSSLDVSRADVLAALGKLVALVDGIPLAIELLAPQIASAGVDFVVERLKRRPEAVLDARASGTAVLRSAFESAWSALDAREQRALACLSVFRGSFELTAALAVLEGEADNATDDDLAVMQSLCDKSLLTTTAAGRPRPRFRLLTLLRTFARDKLAEIGGARAAEQRHARFYASLQNVLPDDWDDLVACVERCVASPDPEAARLAVAAWCALEPVFAASGSALEQLELAEGVASLCERTSVDAAVASRAVVLRGDARRRAGDLEGAERDFTWVLAQAKALERPELLGRAERGLGTVRHVRGDVAGAEESFERALHHLEVAREDELRGIVLSDLGTNALAAGHPERARGRLELALDLLERAGNLLHRGGASCNLGVAYLETGEPEAARRSFEQAVLLTRDTGSMVFGFSLANLGLLAHIAGDLVLAREHYERALAVAREASNPLFVGTFSGYLGVVALEEGGAEDGHARFVAATEQLAAAGDARYQALFLVAKAVSEWWLGRGAIARADLERAWALASRSEDAVFGAMATLTQHLVSAGIGSPWAVAPVARASEERPSAEGMLMARLTTVMTREAQRRGTLVIPLRLHREGRWFQIGAEAPVLLRSHVTTPRLLAALATAHAAGETVTKQQLLEVGWSGERMAPAAANNRLKVALSQIRRLGIGQLLETVETGYRLSPGCTVAIADEDDP